jgi:hypothetical protein
MLRQNMHGLVAIGGFIQPVDGAIRPPGWQDGRFVAGLLAPHRRGRCSQAACSANRDPSGIIYG